MAAEDDDDFVWSEPPVYTSDYARDLLAWEIYYRYRLVTQVRDQPDARAFRYITGV